ncbi:sulfurtransferase [Nitrospira sp.]|nr:sulfurtransferase [Nitrospira sp.]
MKHNPGFLKLVEQSRARVPTCSAVDVKSRLDRGDTFHFIDVREESEFAEGHATGARHLGKGIIERDIESLIPDQQVPIILYCGGGYRSILAADALRLMGYTDVTSMDGGIRAWRDAGFPISRGSR